MNTQTLNKGHHVTDTFLTQNEMKEQSVYQRLCNQEATIGLVGLGYVGLPIALEFAKSFRTIGYDINASRIGLMKQGIDPSGELDSKAFENKNIHFTSASETLDKADVIVVAVPTPVSKENEPDLMPLTKACEAIAVSIGKGNIIIFESTVYPGCTEEVCIPILEKVSGYKCNEDFWVGYSPERINPGDKVHTLTNITKIVSGSDEYAQREIFQIYNHIIDAGIHIAPSMKVAEAAKIVENTQRDVNIALMNELSTFFNTIGINTHDVLEAAGTKWNFLNFYPGLVGGHCIGVDPYYLIHKAASMGMNLGVIGESRKINDLMPQHVVDQVENGLARQGKSLNQSKVLVLGATFKENVSDLRNSKAAEMCQILVKKAKQLDIIDPNADAEEMVKYYGLSIAEVMTDHYDVIVYAVNHEEFDHITWEFIKSIRSTKTVIFDFKRLLGHPDANDEKTLYLTL
ncbi:MAG: nucleotide sugar dehydrogenase [Bacteroidota bacterium]